MADLKMPIPSRDATMLVSIVVATCVTVLDGFDSMSLSLAAPLIAKDLTIAISAFGFVFASQMAGMMLGSLIGGAAADKFGRLPMLLSALLLFAVAAFVMPGTATPIGIGINRFLAGIGLGAAAPIAVALVARSTSGRASNTVIGAIWAGLPVGGIIASAFNYFVISHVGWQSIFIAGGIAPIVIGGLTLLLIPASTSNAAPTSTRPDIKSLLTQAGLGRLATLGLLFVFGYATMAIIVFWLPTILHLRGGSSLFVSLAFMGVNIGSAVGSVGLGAFSDLVKSRITLPFAWLLAAACLFLLEVPTVMPQVYFCLAIAAATLTAGAIALAVALASRLQPGTESTSVGLMVTVGRAGQVSALTLSGLFAGHSGAPDVFLLAGCCGLAAAVLAFTLAAHTNGPISASQGLLKVRS